MYMYVREKNENLCMHVERMCMYVSCACTCDVEYETGA